MGYHLLWDCYRSGQMSAAQWNEHLRDDLFVAWLKKHGHL